MWIYIWCFIYLSFLITGLFPEYTYLTAGIRYLGIFLNFLYARRYFKLNLTLELALLFTLLADTILTFDNSAFLGVFTFSLAQFFHFSRLAGVGPRFLTLYLAILAGFLYIAHSANFNYMYVIGAFYGLFLLINTYLSLKWHQNEKTAPALAAAVGFSLFVLCDLCVASSYFSRTGLLPLALAPILDYFAWVFYYPSQIFIANSSKTKKVVLQ